MKIIFLDIDGVLNRRGCKGYEQGLQDCRVKAAVELLRGE